MLKKILIKLLIPSLIISLFLFIFYISSGILHGFKRNKISLKNGLLNNLIETSVNDIPSDKTSLKELLSYYTQTAELSPNDADACGMMGFCYYKLGDFNNAITSYNKAIKLSPNFLWYYHNLGMIYFELKNYAKSAELFNKALEVKKEKTFVLTVYSKRIYLPILAFNADNVYEKMESQFSQGAENCYKFLTLCYFYLEKYDELAKIAGIVVIGKKDNDGFFRYYMAIAALKLQKYDNAISLLYECIRMHPSHKKAYEYLAEALSKINDENSAKEALKKAYYLQSAQKATAPFNENTKLFVY